MLCTLSHPKKLGSIKQGVTSKMTNQFKVMSLNIFSLLPHIDELRILAADERPMSLASMRLKLIVQLRTHI